MSRDFDNGVDFLNLLWYGIEFSSYMVCYCAD